MGTLETTRGTDTDGARAPEGQGTVGGAVTVGTAGTVTGGTVGTGGNVPTVGTGGTVTVGTGGNADGPAGRIPPSEKTTPNPARRRSAPTQRKAPRSDSSFDPTHP